MENERMGIIVGALDENNKLQMECWVTILIMKYLGLLPFRINTLKKVELRSLLVGVSYMITSYALIMWIAVRQMIRRVLIISSKQCDFDCIVFSLATLIVLIPVFLIPFAFWLQVPSIIRFWDEWYSFQHMYEQLTGERIKVQIRSLAVIWVVLSMVIVILITTLPSAFIATFNFWATATYYLIFGCFIAGTSYWVAVSIFLEHTTNNVLHHIHTTFNQWIVGKEKVLACYQLWSETHSLLNHFGNSMSNFVTIYEFTLMLTILNSMYGFISQLYMTELKKKNIIQGFGHLIIFVWSSTVTFAINEASYRVTRTMGSKFREQLLFINLNGKSVYIRNQIIEFFQIFYNVEPKLSISGFNDHSRSFFIEALSAIVTYMIIMLQIRNEYLQANKGHSAVNFCSNTSHL